MIAIFTEKLLFMQAQVVLITLEHKANFSGCICNALPVLDPCFHYYQATILSVKIPLLL